jgi:hypothetical protein
MNKHERYNRSKKGLERHWRYNRSEKGYLRSVKYERSEHGRLTRARYALEIAATPLGEALAQQDIDYLLATPGERGE